MIKQAANNKSRRSPRRLLLLLCVAATVSCSSSTRQFLFDIPPPAEAEATETITNASTVDAQEVSGTTVVTYSSWDANLPPPEIEKYLSWEKASELLPKQGKKNIDWSAALKEGVVRPRAFDDPRAAEAAMFKYDFIIENEKEKFNALFPHSAHTGWLGCENCHTAIYPLRRNPSSMKEMRKGESCGTCHDKVAFSLKQCKRCHINM